MVLLLNCAVDGYCDMMAESYNTEARRDGHY
jgi:hypothetical protein